MKEFDGKRLQSLQVQQQQLQECDGKKLQSWWEQQLMEVEGKKLQNWREQQLQEHCHQEMLLGAACWLVAALCLPA